MQRNNKHFFVQRILAFLWLGMMTTAYAGAPLWTFQPLTATTVAVPANGTAMVQYLVTNQSSKPHTLTMQPIEGITQITTGTNVCGNPFVLNGKSDCILSLQINGSQLNGSVTDGPVVCQQGSTNQCYRPSSANILHITRGSATTATISVNPTTFPIAENSTGSVTVINDAGSSEAAANVTATIPGGSNISVLNTTCGASLAIGASCTITFASGAQQAATTIPIAGDNTNTVNVDATVTNQPLISITGPVQQSRIVTVGGAGLSLVVTNNARSSGNANGITVTNQAACPLLAVNASSCTSVAPGDSCTLELTSNTPYVPCTITVSGNNTDYNPTTLIAFSYSGGLVFGESGGMVKVVTDVAQEFISKWTETYSNIAATSLTDGAANTNAIIADSACTGSPANCAAYQCRNLSGSTPYWYLPARDELESISGALCSNNAIPCNFGGFSAESYWSSSQYDMYLAEGLYFPSQLYAGAKIVGRSVRCVRTIPII